MKYVIYYLIAYLLVFAFYFFTVIIQTRKMEKFKNTGQIMYFVKKYKLNLDKINIKKFVTILSLANAFIIATAFMVTFLTESLILQLLLGLVVLIPLMLLVYHIIGKAFQKKEGK